MSQQKSSAQTKISFDLPKSGWITLHVYNVTGRRIRALINKKAEAGYYTVCSKCMNLACPVNDVPSEARALFFDRNPSVGKAWNGQYDG